MHAALQKLFERHAGGAYDKQMYLHELIGNRTAGFDAKAGTIRFGKDFAWPVQVLGMVSARTGFWKWAWAEAQGSMPAPLLKIASAMRRLGEQMKIPELTTPQLPGGDATAMILSLTASGMFDAHAFYRLATARAGVFMLIGGSNFPGNDVTPAVRIPTVMPQVLQRFPMNHRRALLGYLKYYDLTAEADGSDMIIQNGAGPVLLARFDGMDRLKTFDFPSEV